MKCNPLNFKQCHQYLETLITGWWKKSPELSKNKTIKPMVH